MSSGWRGDLFSASDMKFRNWTDKPCPVLAIIEAKAESYLWFFASQFCPLLVKIWKGYIKSAGNLLG